MLTYSFRYFIVTVITCLVIVTIAFFVAPRNPCSKLHALSKVSTTLEQFVQFAIYGHDIGYLKCNQTFGG